MKLLLFSQIWSWKQSNQNLYNIMIVLTIKVRYDQKLVFCNTTKISISVLLCSQSKKGVGILQSVIVIHQKLHQVSGLPWFKSWKDGQTTCNTQCPVCRRENIPIMSTIQLQSTYWIAVISQTRAHVRLTKYSTSIVCQLFHPIKKKSVHIILCLTLRPTIVSLTWSSDRSFCSL